MNSFILLILLVFLIHQTFFSQTPAKEKFNQLRVELQKKVEKKELASVAIGVIKDGKLLWKETFGWADREVKIKATSKTIYPLGSLSKSITATGVWVLVEKGKLSVDEPVEKYLKSASLTFYQGTPTDLKIRHLLNMEGGIPHQLEYFYDQDKEQIPSLPEQIRHYGFVAFPPGKVHRYSNFSIGILDQVIADVSGQSFAGFMKSEVFNSLGMNRTFVQRPSNITIAKGYDSHGVQVLPNIFQPRGGAGMYSTLDDLLEYGLGHLNRKNLLRSETLERAHDPHPNSLNPYYSSGWGVLPTSGGRISLLSNGAIAGATATLLLVPKENLVIVCLTNTTVGNEFTDGMAFKIAGALLEGYAESLGKLIEKVEPLFAGKPFVADDSYFGNWEGQIKTNQGNFPIKLIFKSDGEILVSFNRQNEIMLTSPRFENGLLNGKFKGVIPTPEAIRKPHQILLELMKEGNKLFGIATARSDLEKPKFYLPYYIELTKN